MTSSISSNLSSSEFNYDSAIKSLDASKIKEVADKMTVLLTSRCNLNQGVFVNRGDHPFLPFIRLDMALELGATARIKEILEIDFKEGSLSSLYNGGLSVKLVELISQVQEQGLKCGRKEGWLESNLKVSPGNYELLLSTSSHYGTKLQMELSQRVDGQETEKETFLL
ncbi:MAG: hypothetical protein JSS61_01600 [Verrucomicrobia bacterium]|nr:hypothetical protein [Verrucomicrobiota bacterium]